MSNITTRRHEIISDLILITPRVFRDDRGYFMESFQKQAWEEGGISCDFVQDNQSFSSRNVLRGLHFQKAPYAQDKLVRVITGEILDLAVDIRPDSPTFLRWASFRLDDSRAEQLFIPKGFAHGFRVLSDSAIVAYKTSAPYAPDCDGGIRWDDPQLAINWGSTSPVLSPKDAALPLISEGAIDV